MLRQLVHYLSIDATDCVNDTCDEIKRNLTTKKQWNTFIISMIQCWLQTVNNGYSEIKFTLGEKCKITSSIVVSVVEMLKCEKDFCQILLLLPEQIKNKLLEDLCKVLQTKKHKRFTKALAKETFTTHSQNIMYTCHEVDSSGIHAFYKNVLYVNNVASSLLPDEVCCYLFYLLDNLLESLKHSSTQVLKSLELDKYGDNSYPCVSLLNKVDDMEVRKIKTILETTNTRPLEEIKGDKLCSDISFIRFMTKILLTLHNSLEELKNGEIIEADLSDTIIKVVMKLRTYLFILNDMKSKLDDYIILSEILADVLKLCSAVFSNNNLVKYVCCDETNMTDLSNMCEAFLETDDEVLFSLWKEEKNKDKKFTGALIRVNKLYHGYRDAFDWLLDCDCVKKYTDVYISTLCVFTINFGSVNLVQRYMKLISEHHKHKRRCIQKVLLKCIPYFSVEFCDCVISSCQQYYQGDEGTILFGDESRTRFEADMNEVINKLTDDEADLKIISRLASLCVVSPGFVIKEIIDRIFSGNLKYTVFLKAITAIPSLLQLKQCEPSTLLQYPTAFVFIKTLYTKHQHSKSTIKSLRGLVFGILKHTSACHQHKITHNILDMFVMENLQKQVFLPSETTLELLQKCIDNFKSEGIETERVFLLLELLLRKKEFVSNPEEALIDVCVINLVDLLKYNFQTATLEEKALFFTSIKEMFSACDWYQAFYFVSLFSLHKHGFLFSVPSSLLEVCSSCDKWKSVEIKDVDKWLALFQLSCISMQHVTHFIESMSAFDADDEVPCIIQSAVTMFSVNVSKFRADRMIQCLNEIVRHQKLQNVSTYFSEDLQTATNLHGMSFAMLVFVQCFVSLYSEATDDEDKGTVALNCDQFITILHLFVNYAKDMTDHLIASQFTLYLLEQLLYASAMFDEGMKKNMSLLLMNVLLALLDSVKYLQGDKTSMLDKCKDTLNISDDELGHLLKEKYEAFVKMK
ncbi:uncharacterized protein LOC130662837 [Hydractinia symbiolongicarpus]|uniref:uncharacterized protein LOC130662792 n=1 Tax=Hydractinia symbiolongicarpus TaxID=13093 RepID=UPI00254D5957|nr:uncharacterized protein LOC130662792 [Hydractinia symbiolongicarpus]XP_057317763.1 uncharacterized protein LOC130662837 [Hydractinia symbiolongicarpus]